MTVVLSTDLPLVDVGDPASATALVLHGGGGPRTVAPIVQHLAATRHVLAPTLPGWDGTALPDDIRSPADLASGLLELLHHRGERGVAVIGSSLGGWIALEMAVQSADEERYAGLVDRIVLVDAIGIVVDGVEIADFFALDPRTLADLAWHDPERGYLDPAALPDDQRTILLGNRASLATIAPQMGDPELAGRLERLRLPTLVVWGESDGIATPAYGRALAAAIPGADFIPIPAAGHLPQLEAAEAVWAALDPFLAAASSAA